MSAAKNMSASVKQRLLNLGRQRGLEFNLVLTRYGAERFLYRLSRSPHGRSFVLKGAIVFRLWNDTPHRPTRDVDLLGRGSLDAERLAAVFRSICTTVVEDDGIVFDPMSVRIERIHDDSEHPGVRVRMEGRLGTARVPVQVDVGFGDVVVPAPELVEFPCLLDHPAPRLHAYRRETVVAEKTKQWSTSGSLTAG
jgi:Nucleotidyl transferase AbiEii toxin, Type IV TA system